MSDVAESFLESHGPALSSVVSQHLVEMLHISPVAARKRVSRIGAEVKRLGYLTFPRKARFMYLQSQFGSPIYWEKLIDALLGSRSAYGLAIAALRQRGGLMPAEHFPIACGAPIKQSRHLSPETIFKRLNEAGLLERVEVSGLGDCIALVQSPGHYEFRASDVRVRLITEGFLLTAVRDWVRKLGIVSYDKVVTRDGENRPMVGTFAWDLTAPSYLGFMTKTGKDGDVPDQEMQRWLQHNVPVLYKAARAHPEWKNLKLRFEFWTTGSLSEQGKSMFETARKTVKESRYSLEIRAAPDILKICNATKDDGLVIAFRKHFMKYSDKGTQS
ncbi:hypothetical protein [Ochrobactrum sp. BTU2]|uniref:hypothetical protein n=1 Tax=Ochrobactrum sp. BTU2 TaxID=2856166 RepID=UPI002119F740|nr:hypothetical protein [Ochrobactrum sp. BTU2]MCQ9148086.1 hypothetical protein [Ochrobactrum sp. BTU2]